MCFVLVSCLNVIVTTEAFLCSAFAAHLTADRRVADNGGKLKAVDVNKKELELEVKELKSLSEAVEAVKEKYPGLVHMR